MARKGIPNFKPSAELRKQVRTYAAVGLTHEQMVLLIPHAGAPISIDTLTRHFADELVAGKAQAIAQLGGRLYQIGMGQIAESSVADQSRAIMFYLKTQAGWRETDRVEIDDLREDRELDDAQLASRIDALLAKGLARSKGAGKTTTKH